MRKKDIKDLHDLAKMDNLQDWDTTLWACAVITLRELVDEVRLLRKHFEGKADG